LLETSEKLEVEGGAPITLDEIMIVMMRREEEETKRGQIEGGKRSWS
jgi:hypothetical protein